MGDSYGDDPSELEKAKLQSRMNSLRDTQQNINSQLWNATTNYYLANGEVGSSQLDEIRNREITSDYNQRKSNYEKLMKYLYQRYYDKLSVLYAQKNMTNKQIEIINNTQYKILEQRDVDNNLTNELTTKNREREYSSDVYRKQLKEIKLYSYLLGILFFLIIIVLALNLNAFTQGNFTEKFYGLLHEGNKKFTMAYLIVVLILIIIFRQFSLAILFLIVYSIITLLTDFPKELSTLNKVVNYS